MPSAYERAVAFTDALVDLRSEPPFSFPIGGITVNAAFLPDLTNELSLEDAGTALKTVRCRLTLPGFRGTIRTFLYISAGPSDARAHGGFPEGSHSLYVHDNDGRKALEIPMHAVVSNEESPIVLTTPISLPEDGPEAEERLRRWLASQGFAFRDSRMILGNATDYRNTMMNLLTIGLLKLHVQGRLVLPHLVEELPPRGLDAEPQEVYLTFRAYHNQCSLEANAINSERLPPVQVPFQVEVAGKTVTMWATRDDARPKAITTCEGDFNSLVELQDALGWKSKETVRLVPLGVRHYRLERVESGVYEVGIFVRVSHGRSRDGSQIDGFETMELYRQDVAKRGYTWFAIDGATSGIGSERAQRFKTALSRGETVVVYFMVGDAGGSRPYIEYTAHLLDLASSPEEIPCPEGDGAGAHARSARIWLKIANLQEQKLDLKGFAVDGGTNLADAVPHGGWMFGYIRRTNRPVAIGERRPLTEAEVVEKVLAYLQANGFHFRRELVLNYWISLKTKPFVILAGISGSGKSKLPMLVANALGAKFCPVPVSPGWTEDSDLLGYRNPLDPTGAFQLTRFTAFLLEAYRDREDRLWFACLDEMNLARVEHYFAKFLSAMEGLNETDRKIELHSGTDPAVLQVITVPPAFFFTGTVNMDETTHTFSPKVLDRANLIEFDVRPEELMADPPAATDPGQPLALCYSDFRRFCATQGDSRFRADLVEIARILYPIRAHFAFRVREEIERFIANGRDLMDPMDLLDLQVHQKILPKIRGSGTALQSALEQLRELAEERGWRRSAAKVEGMLDRLATDGITHFYR